LKITKKKKKNIGKKRGERRKEGKKVGTGQQASNE
jgi:hypothetical protein